MNTCCFIEIPGAPSIIMSKNASDEAFSIVIQPPKFPGNLRNIYLYPKVLKTDKGETLHSAENRHTFSRHSRNLYIRVSGKMVLSLELHHAITLSPSAARVNNLNIPLRLHDVRDVTTAGLYTR